MTAPTIDIPSPDVNTDFPNQLRWWRLKARLTQTALAEASGISRRSIIRWESGASSPWIPELESVMAALHLPEEERRRLVSQLRTLRARLCRSEGGDSAAPPSAFRYLRTIRIRAGIPPARVADALGVTQSTLFRWESGGLIPSTDSIERYYDICHVHPLERMALQKSKHSLGPLADDVDSLAEALWSIRWNWDEWNYVMFDLRFLQLLEHLENLSAKNDQYLPLLAEAMAAYAGMQSNCSRFPDSLNTARRALKLTIGNTLFPKACVYALHLTAARGYYHQSSWRSALRGLAHLDELGSAALNSEYLSWRFCNYAECFTRHGNAAKGDEYSKAAQNAALRADSTTVHLRHCDRARVLLALGRHEESLEIMPPIGDLTPGNTASETYLMSDILSSLGRIDEASHWRRVADKQVVDYNLQPIFEHRHRGAH
ncbi:MAG: helix-turn-helix domain-containing protein [Fimbriimonas sp.]|nr:helix-turn-helix domain-containing protein [Fimbriimonas sp.]